ncbi:hypothetical protein AB0M05_41415 [Streptomyces violaceusniger]|uniref:hypothetical protein n=1 Tax=Streptomyces violaceusniger TaxID=68280 RepID=UPI00343E8708
MAQSAIDQTGSTLIPQCQPAMESPSPAGIVPALGTVPDGALVHVRGLITAVFNNRYYAHYRVTISDTTGSAVVILADDVVTRGRRDELEVGRVLAVVGRCAGRQETHDVDAASWRTAGFSLA